jgi:hypothetical protein
VATTSLLFGWGACSTFSSLVRHVCFNQGTFPNRTFRPGVFTFQNRALDPTRCASLLEHVLIEWLGTQAASVNIPCFKKQSLRFSAMHISAESFKHLMKLLLALKLSERRSAFDTMYVARQKHSVFDDTHLFCF